VLTDTDRIRNLLGRYCELIDAGDFDGVGALFARGGLAAGDGPPFAKGVTAVAAFYRSGTVLHDGSPRTKHLVLDTIIEEQDAAGVTARSSYVVLQGDGAILQPIITGRYVDHFARDPFLGTGPEGEGGWHFVERRFTVDVVGDISHHWAGPT